jgi:tyrosyl-tRNA synthetase
MSKSLNNAIGILEKPLDMYGKLMSISDEMMWRYYELLTDLQLSEIENIKRESHPMDAKKDLARRIVTDFHSAENAKQAAEDWAKQFQKDETPENVEKLDVPYLEVAAAGRDGHAVKLDKLLARCGLAESVSDASRKIKQKAVRVNGDVQTELILPVQLPAELLLRVGRNMRRVAIAA